MKSEAMKRILSLLMVAALLFTSLPGYLSGAQAVEAEENLLDATTGGDTGTLSGSCGTSATWSLADGTLTISGSGTITDYSDTGAPWYAYAESITKIVVEGGVTKLGNNAFSRLENVTEISLPESVTSIATSAIRYCTKLERLTIPGNLTFLGARALANGGIVDLYFEGNYPESFSGTTAFDKEVYSLHVPCDSETWTDADLTKFGGTPTKVVEHNYVDGICSGCGESEPGAAVTTPGGSCGDNGNNATWSLVDGTLTISGTGAIQNCPNQSAPWYDDREQITAIVVGEGITKIGSYAFYNLTAATSTSLPSTLTNFQGGAFQNCSSLKELTIPSGVTVLSKETFKNSGITELTFEGSAPTTISTAGDGVCYGMTYNLNVSCGEESWTNEAVDKLKGTATKVLVHSYVDGICSGCGESDPDAAETTPGGSCGTSATWSLVDGTLTISGSGTITDYSDTGAPWYAYAESITKIVVESGVTKLGNNAFSRLENVTEISLPESVTSIATSAIRYCTKLERLTIPGNLTFLGARALANGGIVDLYFEGNYPESFSGTTAFDKEVYSLHVPCNNETWTDADLTKFGGTPTEVVEHNYVDGICDNCGYRIITSETWAHVQEIYQTYIANKNSLVYGNTKTAFNATTTSEIDCSSFVQLVLYGVPYENSRYSGNNGNVAKYDFGVLLPANDGDWGAERYLANELAEYADKQEWAIGQSDIQPGDVLFFSPVDNAAYYKNITHVAICAEAPVDGIVKVVHGTDGTNGPVCEESLSMADWKFVMAARFPLYESGVAAISLTMSQSTATLELNETLTLTVTVAPANASKRVTWTSSAEAVATVDASGRVTPVSAGKTTITATAVNGGASATCEVTVNAPAESSGTCGTNVNWRVEGTTLYITGSGRMTAFTKSGGAVQGRGYEAWAKTITKVVVGEGVTSLDDRALDGFTALAEIVIPASVNRIATEALNGCTALKEVSIPGSLIFLGARAFEGSGIETLILSGDYPTGWGGSKPIATAAREYTIKYPCNNSTWAAADPSKFGGNPTMVMNHDLNGSGICTICGGDASQAVTAISLDKTEVTMNLADSLTLVATLTPANAGNKLVEWTSSNPKVATVLGGKVTPIGAGETIITAIAKGGEDAKATCVVTVTDGFSGSCGSNATYTVVDGVLTIMGSGTVTQQEAWTTQKDKITSIVVENGITELGSKAFAELDKVTAVTLPSGLKKIQAQAFKDCTALSELTVPTNVTTIGAYAIQSSGIKTLIFEKHPTGTISTEVCKGMTDYVLVLKKCSGWTDAEIEKLGGTRATTVDEAEFEGAAIQNGVVKYHTGTVNTEDAYHCSQCDGTFSGGSSGGGSGGGVVSGASSGVCGESATYRIEGNTLIISGTGTTKTYTRNGLSADYPWAGYKKDITKIIVEEGIASLGNYAFYGLTKVTEVSLPQSLTRIETRVFGRMTSLKSITIPSTLAFLGYEAFVQSGITDIYFGAGAPVNVSTTKPCTGLTYTLHTVCSDKTWTEEKLEQLGGNVTLAVEHLEDYFEESGMCSRCAKFQETSASGECGENATWTLENGILTISGTGVTTKYKRISGNVIDYPWVGYVNQITKVVVKEGITSLDNYAFYAFSNLTTVELPSSLKRIETRVFGRCGALTTLRIPSKLTFLGYEAFGESGITELWFDSDGPENLSGNAPCVDLIYTLHVICSDKSWTEAKLHKLGGTPTLVVEHRKDYSATSGTCSRCGEVKLASDSGKCGESATWTLKNGVLTICGTGATTEYKRVTGNVIDYPWADYVDQITTVIVEEGITSLDNYAFYAFPNLTTVELPSSLKRIETRVFGKCGALTTLRIPSRLVFLGYEAFGESGIVDLYFSTDAPENLSKNAPCTGMTYCLHMPCNNISWSEAKITAMGGEATVVEEHKLVNGTCIYCAAAAEGKIIGDVGENAIWMLKNGVLTITGTGALPTFSRNAEKDTINYPWADYKDQITTVVVGKGITSIGNYSFYRFTKLSSVKLPDSLEEIAYGAFYGTVSLTDITIPENVSKFGSQVFMGSGLKTITFKGMLPTSYGKNLFDGVTATAYHRCDVDPKSMGQGLTWQAYHEYADENGIGKCSVCGAVNGALVESLALDCSELTLFVGDSATLHTTLLPEDAVFPVVAWESGEEEVAIVSEAGVVTAIAPGSTMITVRTMDGSNLAATCKVSVKKGVGGTVGDILWSFDNGVLTLSGADAALDIAQDAAPWLQYKDEITQLVVEDGILSIGDGAFASFDRLVQLELPASLTSIGKEAFRDTTALQQVELPASLETIGDGAFRNSGLVQIRFNGGLPTRCGTDVFDGVSAEAYIPCEAQEQNLGGEISWVKTHDYQPSGDQFKCIHCGDVQQGEGETPQSGENQPTETEKNNGVIYALVAGAVIVVAAVVFLLRSKAKKNKMGAKK